MADTSGRARRAGRLLVIALPLYFVWEVTQMPGYVPEASSRVVSLVMCGLATLGDGAIVLALWRLGGVVFRDQAWFTPPRAGRYLVIVLVGVAVNALIEWLAVHQLHIWAYSARQPTLPLIGTGVFAVLQPSSLLPLTFWLLHRWEAHR